jgi:hypothetical protein
MIIKIQQDYEKRISQERERALLENQMREREEIEKKRKQDLQLKFISNTVAVANKVKEQHKIIDNYVKLFSENHGRSPLKDEIRAALTDQIDTDIFEKFLGSYQPTNMEEEEINFDIHFDGEDDRV